LRQTAGIHIVFFVRLKKARSCQRVEYHRSFTQWLDTLYLAIRLGPIRAGLWISRVGTNWLCAIADNYMFSSADASRRTRMPRKTESLCRIPTCHDFDTRINDTRYYLEAFLIHTTPHNNTHETLFCACATYRSRFLLRSCCSAFILFISESTSALTESNSTNLTINFHSSTFTFRETNKYPSPSFRSPLSPHLIERNFTRCIYLQIAGLLLQYLHVCHGVSDYSAAKVQAVPHCKARGNLGTSNVTPGGSDEARKILFENRVYLPQSR